MTYQTSALRLPNSVPILVTFLATGLLAFACSSDPATESASTSSINIEELANEDEVVVASVIPEDTVVWLHDVEPATLNSQSELNLGSSTSSWITQGLLEGLFGVSEELTFELELLAVFPEVTETEDEILIEYSLRDDLRWSDGEPLDTSDVVYTFDRIAEGCATDSDGSIRDNSNADCVLDWVDRSGYSAITDIDTTSDTEFSITLSRPVGEWQRLFDVVFAEHAFGEDSSELGDLLEDFSNEDSPLPTSGPYTFVEWLPGESILMQPNTEHRDFASSSTANVLIRFLPNKESLRANLDDSRGHFILNDFANQPIVTDSEDIAFASTGGWQWEHLGINTTNPHLTSVIAREAIAAAIDKQELISSVFEPFHGVAADSPLGNSFWLSYQPGYINNQDSYVDANLELVTENMESLEYTQVDNGLWTHPDLGPAEFRIAIVEGDTFQTELASAVVTQLNAAGFGASIVEVPGGDFFTTSASGEGPFASQDTWDLTLFSWASGPWPGGQISAYGGSTSANNINNIYGYSNEEFDDAAESCGNELSPEDAVTCFNELDLFATTVTDDTGLFIVPLGERPSILAYNIELLEEPIINDFPGAGPLTSRDSLIIANGAP